MFTVAAKGIDALGQQEQFWTVAECWFDTSEEAIDFASKATMGNGRRVTDLEWRIVKGLEPFR